MSTVCTPYILRPVPWNWSISNIATVARTLVTLGGNEYYTVVGDCYVHSFALHRPQLDELDSTCFNIV
jgi:hypothetical protein